MTVTKTKIHPNELRIGNLVYPNKENSTPWKIMEISQDEVRFGPKNDSIAVSLDVIEPIPLTPEILESFGFGKINSFEIWSNGKIGIGFKDGEFSHDGGGEGNYLHQLQNLHFALTGEELG